MGEPVFTTPTGYGLKWTLANDFNLVFVVVYQKILQLLYLEDLLETVKDVRTTATDHRDSSHVTNELHHSFN